MPPAAADPAVCELRPVAAAAGVEYCLPLPLLVLGEGPATDPALEAAADAGRCVAAVPALAGRGVVALLLALLWLRSPTEASEERLLLLAEGGPLGAARAVLGCWSCAAVPSAFKEADEALLLEAVGGVVECCWRLEPLPAGTLFLLGLGFNPAWLMRSDAFLIENGLLAGWVSWGGRKLPTEFLARHCEARVGRA